MQELKLLELLEEQLIELDEEWLHDELDEQDNEEEDETELEQLKKETVTDNPNFMFKIKSNLNMKAILLNTNFE